MVKKNVWQLVEWFETEAPPRDDAYGFRDASTITSSWKHWMHTCGVVWRSSKVRVYANDQLAPPDPQSLLNCEEGVLKERSSTQYDLYTRRALMTPERFEEMIRIHFMVEKSSLCYCDHKVNDQSGPECQMTLTN